MSSARNRTENKSEMCIFLQTPFVSFQFLDLPMKPQYSKLRILVDLLLRIGQFPLKRLYFTARVI